MTVPIYITAAILAVVFAYISDKVGKRSPFIIGFLLMMLIGFSMYVPLPIRVVAELSATDCLEGLSQATTPR